MMVSDKQLIANRENAKKGGPKTEEGKAIVRLNAFKHGLFAEDLVLPDEEREALNELWERLIVELEPQGTLEEMVITCIVSTFWRRQMAVRLETNYLYEQFTLAMLAEEGEDLQAWTDFLTRELGKKKAWQNLLRYQTSFENKFFKAIHELERMKMARRGEAVTAPLTVDVDISNDG